MGFPTLKRFKAASTDCKALCWNVCMYMDIHLSLLFESAQCNYHNLACLYYVEILGGAQPTCTVIAMTLKKDIILCDTLCEQLASAHSIFSARSRIQCHKVLCTLSCTFVNFFQGCIYYIYTQAYNTEIGWWINLNINPCTFHHCILFFWRQ